MCVCVCLRDKSKCLMWIAFIHSRQHQFAADGVTMQTNGRTWTAKLLTFMTFWWLRDIISSLHSNNSTRAVACATLCVWVSGWMLLCGLPFESFMARAVCRFTVIQTTRLNYFFFFSFLFFFCMRRSVRLLSSLCVVFDPFDNHIKHSTIVNTATWWWKKYE